ncbi:MAG: hypothetical protein U0176_27240 [Bacteroidia bacterium]
MQPSQSIAQGSYEVDLKDLVHSVSVSGGTLNANQAGTVSVTIGSSAAQVDHALGLRLVLGIHANAVLPSNPLSVNVSGSWMLAGAELSQSLEVNASTRIMTLTLERDPADGSASGYGFVLSFPLVAAQNGVSASSMVTSVDGVVIVENVDLRMAGPHHGALGMGNDLSDADDRTLPGGAAGNAQAAGPADSETREMPDLEALAVDGDVALYPNPCVGELRVGLPGDGDAVLRLVGMDGRVHSLSLPVTGGIGTMDIAAMPRGLYWAEVMQRGRVVGRQRLAVGGE